MRRARNVPCSPLPDRPVLSAFGMAQSTRRAFAASITATISECGQRLMPPIFTGFGIVPSATRRQKVALEQPSKSAASPSRISGSLLTEFICFTLQCSDCSGSYFRPTGLWRALSQLFPAACAVVQFSIGFCTRTHAIRICQF